MKNKCCLVIIYLNANTEKTEIEELSIFCAASEHVDTIRRLNMALILFCVITNQNISRRRTHETRVRGRDILK